MPKYDTSKETISECLGVSPERFTEIKNLLTKEYLGQGVSETANGFYVDSRKLNSIPQVLIRILTSEQTQNLEEKIILTFLFGCLANQIKSNRDKLKSTISSAICNDKHIQEFIDALVNDRQASIAMIKALMLTAEISFSDL